MLPSTPVPPGSDPPRIRPSLRLLFHLDTSISTCITPFSLRLLPRRPLRLRRHHSVAVPFIVAIPAVFASFPTPSSSLICWYSRVEFRSLWLTSPIFSIRVSPELWGGGSVGVDEVVVYLVGQMVLLFAWSAWMRRAPLIWPRMGLEVSFAASWSMMEWFLVIDTKLLGRMVMLGGSRCGLLVDAGRTDATVWPVLDLIVAGLNPVVCFLVMFCLDIEMVVIGGEPWKVLTAVGSRAGVVGSVDDSLDGLAEVTQYGSSPMVVVSRFGDEMLVRWFQWVAGEEAQTGPFRVGGKRLVAEDAACMRLVLDADGSFSGVDDGTSPLNTAGRGDLPDVWVPPPVTACTMFSCGSSLAVWFWGAVDLRIGFPRSPAPGCWSFLTRTRAGIA